MHNLIFLYRVCMYIYIYLYICTHIQTHFFFLPTPSFHCNFFSFVLFFFFNLIFFSVFFFYFDPSVIFFYPGTFLCFWHRHLHAWRIVVVFSYTQDSSIPTAILIHCFCSAVGIDKQTSIYSDIRMLFTLLLGTDSSRVLVEMCRSFPRNSCLYSTNTVEAAVVTWPEQSVILNYH